MTAPRPSSGPPRSHGPNIPGIASQALTPRRFTPWRWGLAATGLVCFALGFVGAVVPGMPTTVFLLIGSYCLTRSCPWLEERLLNTRLLAPYGRLIRSDQPLSTRARLIAIGLMTASVAVSAGALLASGRLTPVLAGVVAGLWLCGLVGILLFRRRGARPGGSPRTG